MSTNTHCAPAQTARRLRQFLLVALSATLPLSTAARDPLDANASVPGVQYQSELNDFRAFEPDADVGGWAQANRDVLERGGWRAYLRRANPTSSGAANDPGIGDLNAADQLTVVPAKTRGINDKPSAPASNAREISVAKPKRQEPKTQDVPVATAPEPAMRTEVAIATPPASRIRIRPGDCPRVVTGTRIALPIGELSLTDQARNQLRDLARCFSKRRYIIGGHTDNAGSSADKRALSAARAKAAAEYLISLGVSPGQIRPIGYGDKQPIDTNRTERGRLRNNRLDFRFDR